MILNAVKKGVSEERLARALNVNIGNIRAKRNLLVGICPEAADLLKDKHVPLAIFTELRFLQPIRQIEACQLMIAMNRFNASYAKSIVAATPAALMAEGKKRRPRGLTDEQIALMQTESAGLDREFRIVEQSYSADHLDLTLALGYVSRLLSNASVVRYLARHHGDLLAEFQKVTEPSVA